MFDENTIKRIKRIYPKGTEVELVSMEDPYSVPSGTHGVVEDVDDIGTIFVKWDNGSSLGLIFGVDQFIVVKRPNPALEDLEIAKKQLNDNDTLSLFTYNKETGNTGVAVFIQNENKVKVFEGNPDGSDDIIMSYEEFINNYKYKVADEFDSPFKDIDI